MMKLMKAIIGSMLSWVWVIGIFLTYPLHGMKLIRRSALINLLHDRVDHITKDNKVLLFSTSGLDMTIHRPANVKSAMVAIDLIPSGVTIMLRDLGMGRGPKGSVGLYKLNRYMFILNDCTLKPKYDKWDSYG